MLKWILYIFIIIYFGLKYVNYSVTSYFWHVCIMPLSWDHQQKKVKLSSKVCSSFYDQMSQVSHIFLVLSPNTTNSELRVTFDETFFSRVGTVKKMRSNQGRKWIWDQKVKKIWKFGLKPIFRPNLLSIFFTIPIE